MIWQAIAAQYCSGDVVMPLTIAAMTSSKHDKDPGNQLESPGHTVSPPGEAAIRVCNTDSLTLEQQAIECARQTNPMRNCSDGEQRAGDIRSHLSRPHV